MAVEGRSIGDRRQALMDYYASKSQAENSANAGELKDKHIMYLRQELEKLAAEIGAQNVGIDKLRKRIGYLEHQNNILAGQIDYLKLENEILLGSTNIRKTARKDRIYITRDGSYHVIYNKDTGEIFRTAKEQIGRTGDLLSLLVSVGIYGPKNSFYTFSDYVYDIIKKFSPHWKANGYKKKDGTDIANKSMVEAICSVVDLENVHPIPEEVSEELFWITGLTCDEYVELDPHNSNYSQHTQVPIISDI